MLLRLVFPAAPLLAWRAATRSRPAMRGGQGYRERISSRSGLQLATNVSEPGRKRRREQPGMLSRQAWPPRSERQGQFQLILRKIGCMSNQQQVMDLIQ